MLPETERKKLIQEVQSILQRRTGAEHLYPRSLTVSELVKLGETNQYWYKIAADVLASIAKIQYANDTDALCRYAFTNGKTCPYPWKSRKLLGTNLEACKPFCQKYRYNITHYYGEGTLEYAKREAKSVGIPEEDFEALNEMEFALKNPHRVGTSFYAQKADFDAKLKQRLSEQEAADYNTTLRHYAYEFFPSVHGAYVRERSYGNPYR